MKVSITIVLFTALMCMNMSAFSQEIQYDTSAAKLKLGKELWKIQGTNGMLTMSLDGSKILVASAHNGRTFSIVDVQTGTAKVLKGVEYYGIGGANLTDFSVDSEFELLCGITLYSKDTAQERRFLYDLEADTVISDVLLKGPGHFPYLCAISKKYNLLLSSDGTLRNPQTYEVVDTLPAKYSYGQSFFDDAHGRIYWYSGGGKTVQEYDIASRAIRQWYISKAGINAVKIIRGSESPWLYVATLNDGNSIGGNAVYAINTENNEKIEFTQHPGGAYAQQFVHMPEGTIWVTPTGVGVQGYSGNTMNTPRGQMAWELSAETRSTKIMANPGGFKFRGTPMTKEFIITPDFSRAIHGWNSSGDSAILRCNELVPNITSIPTPEQRTSSWFTQKPSSIEIRQALQAAIVRVEIATMEGRLVLQRPVTVQEQIITIPTQGFAQGSYVCTVVTEKERLSMLFIIC